MQQKDLNHYQRNKMTEKEYTSHRGKKTMAKQAKAAEIKKIVDAPKKEEIKKEEVTKIEKVEKKIEKKPEVKRDFACVNITGAPISSKDSFDVCRFIKFKTISRAVKDLEEVVAGRKAIPMRGEIPHRKGKIMSGRFPKVTSEHFIKIIKSLGANSLVNGLENPIISEAVANRASRPFGRFGAVRRKRTHIRLVAREKKVKEEKAEAKKK